MELITKFLDDLKTFSLIRLFNAAAILVIGYCVVRLVAHFVRKLLNKTGLDKSAQKNIVKAVKAFGYFVVLISCLGSLGVPVTSLIAILGAIGLAFSLALQDVIANLAGGLLILTAKPFSTGDFIEVTGGISGRVTRVNFIHTVVNTLDNRRVMLPNGALFKGNITNISAEPCRVIELTFPVSYFADVRQAKRVIEDVVTADPRVLKDPPVTIGLTALSYVSADVTVRLWAENQDFIVLKSHLLEQVKGALDQNALSVPAYRQAQMDAGERK